MDTATPVNLNSGEFPSLSPGRYSPIRWEGITLTSATAFYHAAKAKTEEDFKKFHHADNKQARALAQNIEIRPDWKHESYAAMFEANYQKFKQHPKMLAELKRTGSRPIINPSSNDPRLGINERGKGGNGLGKILMQIRDSLPDGDGVRTAAGPTHEE